MISLERAGSDLEITFTNTEGDTYSFRPYTGDSTDVNLEEDMYDLGTATLNSVTDDQVFILQEAGSTSDNTVTYVVQVSSISASNDEVTFKKLLASGSESFTVSAGDEIIDGTGAYLCNATGNSTDLDGTTIAIVSDDDDCATAAANAVAVNDTLVTEFGNRIVLADEATTLNVTIIEDDADIEEDADVDASTIKFLLSSDSDDDMKIGGLVMDNGVAVSDDDSDVKYGLTELGTYIELDTENDASAVLYMPEEEADYMVYISSGAQAAGGVIPVITDSQVASYSDDNLIIIGGTCINKAAAMQLTGAEDAVCGAEFTALTDVASGQYLIEVAASKWNAEKIAMVVAGYEKADTAAAVDKVMEGKTSTDVGTSMVGPVLS
jgi:hypothetical protein